MHFFLSSMIYGLAWAVCISYFWLVLFVMPGRSCLFSRYLVWFCAVSAAWYALSFDPPSIKLGLDVLFIRIHIRVTLLVMLGLVAHSYLCGSKNG